MLPRLLGIVLALALSSCALVHPHFEQPTVRLAGVQLRGGSFFKQDFAVKLNVQNPNDRALPVKELAFTLKLEGIDFASGVSEQAFSVPPKGDADFELDVSTNLALAVTKLAQKRQQNDPTLGYELEGTARVDLPFVKPIPFHQIGVLPLADLFKYLN